MQKNGTKTMLLSVIMSAPGPLVLLVGLFMGKSNTQIADFIRRSIELLAIVVSFIAYQITAKKHLNDEEKNCLEQNTNLFVGIAMCVAGVIMLCVTFLSENEDKGNVVFPLVIALLGATANSIFWARYTVLSKREDNAILAVQARLYRAKTFVDLCVTVALVAVLAAPMSALSYYLDLVGSAIVSIYLAYSGVKIIIERFRKKDLNTPEKTA